MLPRWWLGATCLLVAGGIVRLALILGLSDASLSGPDGPSYDTAARALLGEQDVRDTWQVQVFPIGYSMTLAAVYTLFGLGSIWVLLALQTVAQLATAALLAHTLAVALSRTVGMIALALLVLAPSTIEISTSLMYESLLLTASCAILSAVVRLRVMNSGSAWLWILGIASLTAVFVHPRYLVLVVAVAASSLLWRRAAIPLAATLISSGVLGIILLGVWNFSNLGVIGVSSNQGSNLVLGLDEKGLRHCSDLVYPPTAWEQTTASGDLALTQCAQSWVVNHPVQWLERIPGKLAAHFEPATLRVIDVVSPASGGLQGALSALAWIALALSLGLSLLGMGYLVYSGKLLRPLAAVCASAIAAPALLSAVFFGLGRFSYTSLPFLFTLMALGVSVIATRLAGLRRRATLSGAAEL